MKNDNKLMHIHSVDINGGSFSFFEEPKEIGKFRVNFFYSQIFDFFICFSPLKNFIKKNHTKKLFQTSNIDGFFSPSSQMEVNNDAIICAIFHTIHIYHWRRKQMRQNSSTFWVSEKEKN